MTLKKELQKFYSDLIKRSKNLERMWKESPKQRITLGTMRTENLRIIIILQNMLQRH